VPRHSSENTVIVTGWTGYARKLPAELPVYQVELRTRKGGAKVAGEAGSDNPYYERGSPCEKVYVESFNARLKDWLLNEE